jgi:hypothetical protein
MRAEMERQIWASLAKFEGLDDVSKKNAHL